MSFVVGERSIVVPATSANLGPGFDSLGLALTLFDTLTAEVVDSGLLVEVEGVGAADVPRDDAHLVVRAMRAAFAHLDVSPPGLRLHCHNRIPHARGLGSSSAAIVGGLAVARDLVESGHDQFCDDELFALAARIEGHPDNVAPATYGGLNVCGVSNERAYAARAPIDPRYSTVVFVPPTPVSTELARGLLPDSLPHREAAANSGRTALLVAALGGLPGHLLVATEDFLHQGYRRTAMPESFDLMTDLRAAGVPAVISGAGPTVLAFTGDESLGLISEVDLHRRCPSGWTALSLDLDHEGVRARR